MPARSPSPPCGRRRWRSVRPADHTTVCRLLVKHHNDLARWRNKLCCRLHALVGELVPGGIDKEVVVNQARSLLEGIEPDDVAAVERHRQAVELVAEIDHLDVVMRDSRARITTAVAASETTLTEIFGVGPIVAGMLIGYTGDPTRFATASRFAAYTGTAPVEFSSGGRVTHRLSRRGNRRLNHALHIAAITQIRHPHSPGRRYYDRKLAEGKTPREAIRALEATAQRRRLAAPRRRRPARRHPMTSGPGQDTPGRLCRLRDRLTPEHRLFGEVTTRTLNPTLRPPASHADRARSARPDTRETAS